MKIYSLLPFALFAACTSTQSPAELTATPFSATSESDVIGGIETTGDPAIIALYARAPDADAGFLCTATVVAPTVLLTAAHCVHPANTGEGVEFNALLGANLTDANNPSPRIKVASVHYDPAFNPKNIMNGHDIAVAILSEPVDITPIKINRREITRGMDGLAARLVGYGLNKGYPQKGAGVKRTATVKLNSHDTLFVKTGGWKARICSGDSGGPVLMTIDGEEQIVGVNSFGLLFCLGTGTSTRVDTYGEFIDQYVR